ncbi:MAG: ATP-grasp domain-containing protein [Mogibacterium sp.]|nr:ATP-grasp domain-containing protein [Mogibacterium sp.]
MKKNIAILGASYHQMPLIERAKEMGYCTHVFAWAADDVGEKAADHFYPISITEKEEILEKCREIGIEGICSISSDLAMIAVNYVGNELGLNCNTMECTEKSTNKHKMRLAFEKNGDPSPKSIQVDADSDLTGIDISYPAIVKPTDRSGSRGIYKISSKEEIPAAVKGALEQSLEKKALIEEFAEGDEYSVEYISYKGKHHFLAVTKKYTTGAPHFIETGHLEPAPVSDELKKKIQAVVEHALDTLEIKNGASHSEIKIDDEGRIRIIEIGGRMGGDCIGSDLVMYSTGYDFVRMVINVACGDEPDFTPVCEPFAVESVFIFDQDDLDEFNRIKEEEPERIVRVVDLDLDLLGSATDSSTRAGCYIIRHKD